MLDRIKKRLHLTITCVVLIILGIYFLCAPAETIKTIVFVVIGIILIFLSIAKMVSLKDDLRKENIVMPIVTIVIGIVLIMFSDLVNWVFIVCGIYILVEPCINLIRARETKRQFSLEFPKIILGVVLIALAFDAVYAFIFSLIGVLILVIGIYIAFCVLNDQELLFTLNKEAFKHKSFFRKTKTKTRERDDDEDIIDV